MSDKLLASILSILLGTIPMLPWIFVRTGRHKRWYLAPFIPPIMWGRAVYMWPVALFFIFVPIIAILPINKEIAMNIIGVLAVVGVLLAIIMVVWTPDWAKPKWQRYLENKYTWSEIRGTFIPVWRKMDRKKWSRLLNSEEGIEELVRIARKEKYGYP